ncbi:fam-a protein [Plasmodium vinckei]|uniref:Fam-a protein n=1 Tax=Plasmodium vinckei TaxID=5860 RepID=A0A6V7SAV4_PLAVN|nr:fam-a protein [Plasmodium vinckei]
MSKFYIQIVLFLLSISVCLNNTTLAADPSPKKASQKVLNKAPNNVPNKAPNEVSNKIKTSKSNDYYPTPEEIFEEKKDLLCEDPEETKQAIKLINEAVTHLVYHATNNNASESCKNNTGSSSLSCEKKYEKPTNLLADNRKLCHFGLYNGIVNMFWNPERVKIFIDNSSISKKAKPNRKIVRVYNPNLVMILQRYKKGSESTKKYFYALAAKVDLSEDKTIIVMTSVNVNDGNPSNKEYKNTIIENANLFKTEIDSEKDIQEGKLQKVFVNIAGYLIEKIKGHIHMTYIESINEENST